MVEYYGARVLFDFTSAAPDELSLRKGESVEVRVDATTDCEEGWLSGSDIHGYHGVFPANYVEDLRTETRAVDGGATWAKAMRSSNDEAAPELKSNGHSAVNEELSFQKETCKQTATEAKELARVQEMEEAATRIQAVQRGRSTRRAVDNRRANQRALRQASCRRRRESSYFENARDQLGANSARDGADKDNQPMSSDAIAGEGQSTAVIDKRTAEAIATLIDDRIMEELWRRDVLLTKIQSTVKGLAKQRLSPTRGTPRTREHNRKSPARSPRASLSPTRRIHPFGGIVPRRIEHARSDLVEHTTECSLPASACTRSQIHGPSGLSLVGANDATVAADPSLPAPSCLRPLCERAPRSPSQLATNPRTGGAPTTSHAVGSPVGFSLGFTGNPGPKECFSQAENVETGAGGAGGRRGGDTPLPRVAYVERAHQVSLEKQKTKAAEAKALVKPRTRGGSSLYNPSWYDPSHAHTSAPGSTLELEYVHGYAGEMPVGSGRIAVPDREQARRAESTRHAATRSTNVFWLHTGELMFPASAVVVIHESATNRQRFFTGHDEEVTALAVHPHNDIVASGQAGKEAIVCLFDASCRVQDRHAEAEADSPRTSHAGRAEKPRDGDKVTPPMFLRELSLGKKEKRGVAALDFSSDGNLLLAMGGGEGQTLSVWDWRRGTRMASARAESAFLRAHSIRFNPYLYLTGRRAETAGFPPGSACYTLVSCGERHVRFWTLDRQWHPRGVHSGGDGGRDAGDGGGEWMWSLHSKPGHFGRRGDMSDATCVTFIGEPRARGNHRTGRYGTMDPSVQRLPAARTVTGTKSGHIYFWQTTEDDSILPLDPGTGTTEEISTATGWKPHGNLLAVVPNAHSGVLTDMCYMAWEDRYLQAANPLPGAQGASSTESRSTSSPSRHHGRRESEWGRLATCGEDGMLRLWAVVFGDGPSPLELLATIEISTRVVGIGYARSISWDRSRTRLALGTVGNAVCLVQLEEGFRRSRSHDEADSVIFMMLVQGHMGLCRTLSPHPFRPWFVTGGTDRMLRLWDARSRRQLSATRLLEKVCSVAFHPTGHVLAVGSEAGDILLLTFRSTTLTGGNDRIDEEGQWKKSHKQVSDCFAWEVLARKRVVLGGKGKGAGMTRASPPRGLRSDVNNDGGPGGDISDETKYRGAASNRNVRWNMGRGGGTGLGGTVSENQETRGRRTRYTIPSRRRRGEPVSSSTCRSSRDLSPARSVHSGVRGPGAKTVGETEVASAQATGGGKGHMPVSTQVMEVNAIRFSPDGEVLAAACGSALYLYVELGPVAAGSSDVDGNGSSGRYGSINHRSTNENGAYRQYGTCVGHSTTVKAFDFSTDGSVLQSNDASGELLFWDVSTGKQITSGFSLRDVEMASWSCPVGWPTQGLVTPGGIGGGGAPRGIGTTERGRIVAVCRSNSSDVIAVGDEDNSVRLARNPALEGAATRAYWGHSTASGGIPALAFLCDDRRLVSAGGTCTFVWRHMLPSQCHLSNERLTGA